MKQREPKSFNIKVKDTLSIPFVWFKVNNVHVIFAKQEWKNRKVKDKLPIPLVWFKVNNVQVIFATQMEKPVTNNSTLKNFSATPTI